MFVVLVQTDEKNMIMMIVSRQQDSVTNCAIQISDLTGKYALLWHIIILALCKIYNNQYRGMT